MSKSQILLVAILVLGAFSVAFVSPAITAQTPTHRLGFWLVENDVFDYTPQTFFNAMFLTPPYPSSIQVMVFGILQDEMSKFGCSTTAHYVGKSASYWGQVAQMADAYPNIKLTFDIAFDASNGGTGTYGLNCFEALAQSLAQYPSVNGIGIEAEYTEPPSALTATVIQTAMNDVTATGKLFINYYVPPSLLPSGALEIPLVSFPGGDAGGYEQVGVLQASIGSKEIGLASGYYATFPFPGAVTCPIGANAMNAQTAGWNQCVVSTELGTAVSLPEAQRQFLELCVGYAPSSFTGVSGQTTTQLWDNPTLRNWIWTDPNYGPNFILSTSAAPPTTTTATTTTSSSTTITSSSTSSSSSSTTTSSTSTSTIAGSQQLTVTPKSVQSGTHAQTLSYSVAGGPDSLAYKVYVKAPGGNAQVFAQGTTSSTGAASGTISDTFDIVGTYQVAVVFANSASSNVVDIQVSL